ncbi:MAG: aspartate aminotransferase [Flavobacteriales bacterium]|jgi:aspartate aminotransferase
MNTVLTQSKVSQMAEQLVGSEIIKLAGEIKEKIANGEKIHNLTIGDFDPNIFSIPEGLKEEIICAYESNETNYPAANGIDELREAVSNFINKHQGLHYSKNNFLIAGGARPLIYAAYQTLVDPGDTILFPVPSWNNNHYAHLSHAKQVFIETLPENNFMPTAAELKPYIQDATLLALCSPLNPTGTAFSEEQLREICELVIAENKRRGESQKPLYILYDQIYWVLTYNDVKHVDPVSLYPALKPHTIYIDGLSKAFAATGVRVGWSFGPTEIINKMKAILGHVGAWAPKAEQVATANYLTRENDVINFLTQFKNRISERLFGFFEGFEELKKEGFPVNVINPQAAIYLTVQFNLIDKKLSNGETIKTTADITRFLLEEAKIALVPFNAFGSSVDSTWYRLSVGTTTKSDIKEILSQLKAALQQLS